MPDGQMILMSMGSQAATVTRRNTHASSVAQLSISNQHHALNHCAHALLRYLSAALSAAL
jgi:hypothetical protein